SVSLAGDWRYKIESNLGMVPPPPSAPLGEGNPNTYHILYDNMIVPILPYAIRGAIWYQGESNADRANQYRTLFPLMIRNWRDAWGQGDFPFYFVQLANFGERRKMPDGSNWAELREAQTMTLALPNTGMAVITDIGEANDIHPKNKWDVGLRLALPALHNLYGYRDLVFSGPIYRSAVTEKNRMRISFDHVAGGLVARGALEGFEIAGKDKKFVKAEAKIEGDTVVVWSAKVKAPVAVRYAWQNNPPCPLYNSSDLPASPFRTDNWPGITK
ncbi:MAG: 9-O-acetylesterase, partial [Planctomycetes bacterium]|nr:9-O-acetylesterase [Planctomycetota bacterium]